MLLNNRFLLSLSDRQLTSLVYQKTNIEVFKTKKCYFTNDIVAL